MSRWALRARNAVRRARESQGAGGAVLSPEGSRGPGLCCAHHHSVRPLYARASLLPDWRQPASCRNDTAPGNNSHVRRRREQPRHPAKAREAPKPLARRASERSQQQTHAKLHTALFLWARTSAAAEQVPRVPAAPRGEPRRAPPAALHRGGGRAAVLAAVRGGVVGGVHDACPGGGGLGDGHGRTRVGEGGV